MARFNIRISRSSGSSPVKSIGPATATHEGGAGFLRDEKSELFLLAVTNMVGQDTFYETGRRRDDRYSALVRELAVQDPQWAASLLSWLRQEANLRTAALVGAAEFTRGRLDAQAPGHSRQVIASVLRRADEPGELLAYWTSRYGRNLPKPVKRGIADAVQRLYTERNLLKYDTATKGYRFGDVLELVHASPAADKPWQGPLFKHAIDRRHGREGQIPTDLRMVAKRAELTALPLAERRALLDRPEGREELAQAGMAWETLAGWLQGPMDAKVWEAVIPSMGYMALLRNLRNFDEAGVSDATAEAVADRIADPAEVARSRQLPFRFLAAYRHAPSLRWGHALEQGLGHSLAGVPVLPGRTLVLVDRSGSMFYGISERTQLNRADSAAVFGTAVALRAERADLVEFGTTSRRIRTRRGESVLRVLERFTNLGGTNTTEAVRTHYRGHDRVLIVTDEQASYHYDGDPTAVVPPHVPVYTWNLAGYQAGHGPSDGGNRHTFGGLTDAAFRTVPLLERGRDAGWPWEERG
ncbi:TROVE domain-containing protein [Streptomyces sp. TP-A0874]|uniref:TROVE domain-containing protein n=1 Tax=Streptomyces sp. TP-A0874 TaxID=549819 RepID=UPI00085395A9|nr:TROVE domain-containing protein [Streptomyces sp. TP-A0874]